MVLFFSNSPIYSQSLAVGFEYDGSSYFGWQKQKKPAMPSVQEQLEQAISRVANHPIATYCAGRTDSGVHATNQCVHFETSAIRSEKAWVCGVNSYLPSDIVVKWIRAVPNDFHARFSATARTYRYVILNQEIRTATLYNKVTLVQGQLNIQAMQIAANYLLGEHDFSAYRGSGCQSKSPNRFVESIQLFKQGNLVVAQICANAFLLHMVRNIMGVLIDIGLGKRPPIWAKEVLESKDRQLGGKTASPDGLYLVKAHYPPMFNLPENALGPAFIQGE